jgi:broad specificity phosphatase PhoE
MTLKTIAVLRHGMRLTFEDKNAKKTHPRLIKNPKDDILSPNGHLGSDLAAEALIRQLKITPQNASNWVIYSSPMTRCVETTIHLIDKIYEITGIKLKMHIDYALIERSQPPFDFDVSGKKTKLIPLDYTFDVNKSKETFVKIKNWIDDELKLKGLLKRFPTYIDASYKPLIPLSKHKFVASDNENIDMIISWFKSQILKSNDTNIIIVSHALNILGLYGYLNVNKYISFEKTFPMIGPWGVNTLFIAKVDIEKNKIKSKVIYGPTNDFLAQLKH